MAKSTPTDASSTVVTKACDAAEGQKSRLRTVRKNVAPVIYGDGSQTRDFTYVDDILWMNEQLLETDIVDGEIMNVGSTDNIAIKTLAEVVRDQLAPELELEYGERNAADAEHTHADISKASELLGSEPTTDIREGVSKFIDWYRANEGWYDPLVRDS